MKRYYEEDGITILEGDCLTVLPWLDDNSINCCVTSPPYWGLRDYGTAGQLGLESTPEEYVSRMVEVFREVRRVLRDDGTLWLNLGDSYASGGGTGHQGKHGDRYNRTHTQRSLLGKIPEASGVKPKDLIGIPWRLAFALQADGWYLRSDIIWHKPNPMPESVTDRPTKSHEYLFLLSKNAAYYYDAEAIKEDVTGGSHARGDGVNPKAAKWPNAWSAEPGRHDGIGNGRFRPKQNESFSGSVNGLVDSRNKRSVWTVATEPYPEAHFATFPTKLIEPCIKAGCTAGGTVFDPFGGSGTTMQVARALGCRGLMIELNRDYCRLAAKRLRQAVLTLAQEESIRV